MKPPHADPLHQPVQAPIKQMSTVLLGVIGVALVLGAGARSAAGPAPAFRPGGGYYLGTFCDALAVGDLDGDSRPDVAAGCGALGGGLSVFLSSGKDGTYLDDGSYLLTSVAIGDINGDGAADLVTASGASWASVSVLLNRGDGTFLPPVDYANGAWSVSTGDLNRDGKSDVLKTGSKGNTASVLLSRGDGTLMPPINYRVGRGGTFAGRSPAAARDLNGDGAPDLAVANDKDNSVSVLLNRGDGTFRAKRDYSTGRHPYSLALGDLNGDGKVDVAAATDTGVSLLRNKGNGTFQPKRDSHFTRNGSLAIGDLNGDGAPDLASTSTRGVSVGLNRGDGTFLPRLDYYAGGGDSGSLETADLNGDGRLDLAVTSTVVLRTDAPSTSRC